MTAPASSCSSSSSFSYGWTYDVFLSFRDEDTRFGFTGNLYNALHQRGISTFIDDEELQRGEQITPSLVKAMQESRIAITVLSKNYASSSFCLDELASIFDFIHGKDRLVLPVFYDVDPSDVRHLRGSYGEALAMHEEKFKDNKEKVRKWRMALHQAANLSGWHFKHGDGYEYEFIGKIIKEVSSKINRAPLPVADYPVGLESRVLQVNSLLAVGSNDVVHMVGIYGIGGIGKSTVARAIYNLIADQFEGVCFLDDVRENSIKHGLEHLQEKLLSKIVGWNTKLGHFKEGIPILKHRLHQKKVLLILDDVDKVEQLRAIVGGPDWFGSGSRIIITTRDKHLLATHGVERTYEVDELNQKEALELLSWNAFKNYKVDPNYIDISKRAITYASGLPLALEVIGSNLFGKGIEEWESALDQYERIPIEDIQKILKVSFDALKEYEQKIFLDIACCFKGYKLADVEHILCAHHGVCLKYSIGVLVEKSLIKIKDNVYVTLHDLVEDMGKEIVRQESPEEPGNRSRLWFYEDIVQVLEENTGTSKIQIIFLDFPKDEKVHWDASKYEVDWDGEAFKKMNNLKTLIIRNVRFSKGPKHLPNSLRVLEWRGYPSPSLPSDFHPKKLVILKSPNSRLMLLEPIKKLVNLRVLDFRYSKCITQIPNVSGVPNLEELSFEYCENLIEIHASIGFLDKIKILNARGCNKLRTFPPIKLTSLEQLRLSYCSSLESFPEILEKMDNITELVLMHTSINELPFSIQNLTRLQRLELRDSGMVQLPSRIIMLPELDDLRGGSEVCSNTEHLTLRNCNISDEFLQIGLSWFANVKKLDLSWNNFTILPACIKECLFLWSLILDNCKLLREIRGIPPCMKNFSAMNCRSLSSSCRSMLLNQELHKARNTMFQFPGTRIPEWFEHSRRGESISFWFRNKFPAIALCFVIGQVEEQDMEFEYFCLKLIINSKTPCFYYEEYIRCSLVADHIYIFNDKQIEFNEVLLENEWNHVEVSFDINSEYVAPMKLFVNQIGLHLLKQESRMKDIRFTDPYKRRKLDDDLITSGTKNHLFLKEKHRLGNIGVSHTLSMQQQQGWALMEPHVGQSKESLSLLLPSSMKSLNSNVNWVSTQISSTPSVQGCEIASRKRKIGALKLDNEASELFYQAPSKVVLDSDSIMSSLTSDTATDGGKEKQQHLTSIIPHNFEGCESVNEAKGKGMVACNSNDREDNGRSPLMELLPMTETEEYQVTSDKSQHALNEVSITWDPTELEYQVTYPKHHQS